MNKHEYFELFRTNPKRDNESSRVYARRLVKEHGYTTWAVYKKYYFKFLKKGDEDSRRPNVLVLDIETSPLLVTSWGIHKVVLTADNIIRDWHLLSYAVKWLFEPDIYSGVLTPEEAKIGDDSRITKDVWKFVDKADIIIAHNGSRFDMPKLNTQFFIHNLPPPSPYAQIDTLKVFQRQFYNTSNKQDELCKKYGLSRKVEHEGLEMWIKCINGDKEALDKMCEYNEGDILGLEELYVKVRPWVKSHPSLALYYDDLKDKTRCPHCGVDSTLTWGAGSYPTSVNIYDCWRCSGCGAVGRSRHSKLTKDDRVHLVTTTAR